MKKTIIMVVLLAALILAGCSQTTNTQIEDKEMKISVVTTLFPLYEFAREVGGDKVDVNLLLPPGSEPHSFEPKPSDIKIIAEADAFIYIGEMMEPWAHDILEGSNNEELQVIDASSLVTLLESDHHDEHHDDHEDEEHDEEHEEDDEHHDEHTVEEECLEHEGTWVEEHEECEGISEEVCDELGGEFNECGSACRNDPSTAICTLQCVLVCSFEEHEEEHHDDHEDGEHEDEHEEDDHHHGEHDPHIWLDLSNDQEIVDEIVRVFSLLDSENSKVYEENAEAYKAKLAALDQRYKTELSECEQDEFIVGGHNFFSYIEERYEIEGISAIENLEPNTEPTPKRIKEITDIAEEHGIKYILTEVLISKQMAEAIASEAGAEVLTFNPAPNLPKEDFDKGVTFISVMEDNLETLKKALECE